jgi:hypothetical protein
MFSTSHGRVDLEFATALSTVQHFQRGTSGEVIIIHTKAQRSPVPQTSFLRHAANILSLPAELLDLVLSLTDRLICCPFDTPRGSQQTT